MLNHNTAITQRRAVSAAQTPKHLARRSCQLSERGIRRFVDAAYMAEMLRPTIPEEPAPIPEYRADWSEGATNGLSAAGRGLLWIAGSDDMRRLEAAIDATPGCHMLAWASCAVGWGPEIHYHSERLGWGELPADHGDDVLRAAAFGRGDEDRSVLARRVSLAEALRWMRTRGGSRQNKPVPPDHCYRQRPEDLPFDVAGLPIDSARYATPLVEISPELLARLA